MKRAVFFLILCLTLLASCASTPEPSPVAETPVTITTDCRTDLPDMSQDEVPDWVSCRIIDGTEDGELLLAELNYPLNDRELYRHDGTTVYRLSLYGFQCEENPQPDGTILAVTSLTNRVSVYLDGEPADPTDLRDGMAVEISFNGLVAESFPAQLGEPYQLHAYSIGTPQNPGGSYYDLCGLYLQVLDDLWEKDPGLNSGITLAGLDLSQAPGDLLESEKSALAWRFGEKHGVEVIPGTFEELIDQGYITVTPDDPQDDGIPGPYWGDGCFFSISANDYHDGEIYSGLPILFFNAQKWSSPRGAYYFTDCSALWPESGTWSTYKVGHEAIS